MVLVDGGWSQWNEWDSCSLTCGGGTQVRSRVCDRPKPKNGGKKCTTEGSVAMDTQTCNSDSCPGNLMRNKLTKSLFNNIAKIANR